MQIISKLYEEKNTAEVETHVQRFAAHNDVGVATFTKRKEGAWLSLLKLNAVVMMDIWCGFH